MVKNAQSNASCTRMQSTIGNLLQAMANMKLPKGIHSVQQLVETRTLAPMLFATRNDDITRSHCWPRFIVLWTRHDTQYSDPI